MHVLRDADTSQAAPNAIRRLEGVLAGLSERLDRDGAERALELAGALEGEALDVDAEDSADAAAAWREVTLEAARLFRWVSLGVSDRARLCARRTRRLLSEATDRGRLPCGEASEGADIRRQAAAESWLTAGDRFLRSSAPFECVIIGLRETGAVRSALVAAALEAGGRRTEVVTLRRLDPAGERFDRSLVEHLRGKAARGAWFLIVDEGGDLSVSPACEAAAQLSALGVGDEQIVLFPRAEAPEAASPEARARWGRHRKVAVAAHLLLRA